LVPVEVGVTWIRAQELAQDLEKSITFFLIVAIPLALTYKL
jgi:hypothetical protein